MVDLEGRKYTDLYLLFVSAYCSRTTGGKSANLYAKRRSFSRAGVYVAGRSRTIMIPKLSGWEPKAFSMLMLAIVQVAQVASHIETYRLRELAIAVR